VNGKKFRGVPLQTAEDAAVAAVRLGYRVVDAQITRGLDIARSIRGAADRTGDTTDVLDLSEHLLTRSLLLGLEWLETAASDTRSPVKRLLTAQFRLMSSLLGLKLDDAVQEPRASKAAPRTPPPAAGDPGKQLTTTKPRIRIRHGQGSTKRAVTVARWELSPGIRRTVAPRPVQFHRTSDPAGEQLDAAVVIPPNETPILEIVTTRAHHSGRWRAAVCEDDGEQIGIIEIVL